MNKNLKTLLFIPNIIGYVRFILICWSWCNIEESYSFLVAYILNVLLDGVDGWTARKLNQVSSFGALLDVAVDNFGRGILWCHVCKFGYGISAWEWLVFVCTHAQSRGGQWKSQFQMAPVIVKKIMKNGFKTSTGMVTVSGLHVLPIWLYAIQSGVPLLVTMPVITNGVTWFLIVGRGLALIAEAWCVWNHICALL
ncbi:uncharacterized protein LOC113474121 [Ciona intestinalis]